MNSGPRAVGRETRHPDQPAAIEKGVPASRGASWASAGKTLCDLGAILKTK
jgi:hypothetical protein